MATLRHTRGAPLASLLCWWRGRHDWHLTGLTMDGESHLHDVYRCARCGALETRPRTWPPVTV